ncbi:MAG TPA: coproporphyrinogen dehydrogenase HemZ [Clostridiales bacterium]|nr:coproporphyrinogen dehydrogenase HemZ [Clostridiales bacterium]HBR08317.1 coproporphyrinogen dehydrogenase HemZ [Clostridiales bacterium]
MRLYLTGHDCRYAAEQTLLTLFPGEKPEYPGGKPQGDRCELTMRRGAGYTTCSCRLIQGGLVYTGRAAVKNTSFTDDLAENRLKQRIVKLAFYRAALRSGVPEPEWGSLTGVRPAKLLSAYLKNARSERAAVSRFRREFGVSEARAALCLDAARAASAAEKSLGPLDVCLYIGIPFCPTRCAYCSFVSQSVEKSMKLIDPFLGALDNDIAATAEAVKRAGLRVVSVYMGGGTPTTLSAPQLDRLCGRLAGAFDLSALREYTVEAGRPDTITREKLLVLRDHGVTRISVNPQTMQDGVLAAIGRRHTAADILTALDTARAVGGLAVNMDLIAGLPADTEAGFEDSLNQVLALAPENITVHTLSIKRGARLKTQDGGLPCAEQVGRMLDQAGNRLRESGYAPYYLYRQKFMSGGFENVGWSLPGRENLYNICIMEELRSIIAMGAGGSTKLVGRGGRIERAIAPKYPLEYIESGERLRAAKKEIEVFYHGV